MQRAKTNNNSGQVSSRNTTAPSKGGMEKKKRGMNPLINTARVKTLADMKVDPMLATILSKADLELRLTFTANQQGIVNVVRIKDNKSVGAITDMEKIAGFRKFVNEQNKLTDSEKVMEPVRAMVYRATETAREELSDEDYVPPILQSGPLSGLKDANRAIGALRINETALSVITRTAQGVAIPLCTLMGTWISGILDLFAEYFVQVVLGKDTKGFLTSGVFDRGIPKWAYDKATKQNFNAIAGLDMYRFFFPNDSRKGITFTVRELADEDFRSKNQWILQDSAFQVGIVTSAEVLQALNNGKEEVSLTNEADTIGVALRSEKVLISPLYDGIERLLDPKTKKLSNFCAAPSFSSVKVGLRSILEFGLACQTGDFRSPDNVGNFWNPVRDKAELDTDFVKGVTAKRNYYSVALEHKDDYTEPLKLLRCFGDKELVADLIPILLRIRTSSKIGVEVKNVVARIAPVVPYVAAHVISDGPVDSEGKQPMREVKAVGITPPQRYYAGKLFQHDLFDELVAKVETQDDKDSMTIVSKAAGIQPKTANTKRNKTLALSDLSKTGNILVEKVLGDPKIAFLANPIRDWLKSFVNREIQNVAAGLVSAQFDSLDIDFEEGDESEDEDLDDEPDLS